MYEFWQQDVAIASLYIGFEITHSSFSRPELGNANVFSLYTKLPSKFDYLDLVNEHYLSKILHSSTVRLRN